MTSRFVGLLFIFSIGTLVSSVSIDKWRSSETLDSPKNETSICIEFIDKLLSTNDSRLKDFYLRAAEITCKPDFLRVSIEQVHQISECTEHGPLQKLAAAQCHFPPTSEADCSAKTKALNCMLDLAGVLCGGTDAIVITAIQMEYMYLTSKQPKDSECEIAALEGRLKHPEPSPPSVPPELHPEALCIAIEKGLANLTSDPEYFEQRASKILCDGKELKESVKETNECIQSILLDPEAMSHCPGRDIAGDSCDDQVNLLECHVALYAGQCGRESVFNVYAFETELWFELLKALTKDSSVLRFLCVDEYLVELRAMQKPKKD